jgi:hypothetical protein
MNANSKYPLPPLLTELLAAGIWPEDYKAAMAQNLRSGNLVAPDRVHQFAAEEDEIIFNIPPFPTIADELASSPPPLGTREFWRDFGALDQIVPEKALIIGDFGPGSDAPIILDYARDPLDPPVLRLRYSDGRTDWVQGARNFEEFAAILGLTEETRGPAGG